MSQPNLKASYIIYPDKKLIIEAFSGVLTLRTFIAYKTKQSKDKNFCSDYNNILDLRSLSIIDATIDQIKDYLNFLIESNMVGERRNAILVGTHNQQVYASVFDKLHAGNKTAQVLSVFVDINAAVAFLEREISVEEVLKVLDFLKSNPTEYSDREIDKLKY